MLDAADDAFATIRFLMFNLYMDGIIIPYTYVQIYVPFLAWAQEQQKNRIE